MLDLLQGGFLGVVWVDCLQGIILLVGFATVAFIGNAKAGGATVVFNTAKDLGYWDFTFNGDVYVQY